MSKKFVSVGLSSTGSIIIAGVINYLTRLGSVLLIKPQKLNSTLKNVLNYVPSAVFPAIIFPAVFLNDYGLLVEFNDPKVINGQGTAGYEMINQCEELQIQPDLVLCCCGGGGLIAGISTALLSKFPNLPIYAVEPENYNDTKLSLEQNKIVEVDVTNKSICDALLAPKPGEITFNINKNNLAGALLVSDQEAMYAMKTAFEYLKIVLEPGGAVALAAAIKHKIDIKNKNVLIVASGGNVDKDVFEKSLLI